MRSRIRLPECSVRGWLLVGLAACVTWSGATAAAEPDVPEGMLAQGRDLFTREWLPGDPGSHSGDGLGPVYNDTSCAACHNQGGVGGAGSRSKNVDFLAAIVTPVEGESRFRNDEISRMVRQMSALQSQSKGAQPVKPRAKGEDPDRGPLLKLHRGFRDASSLVLHRFGPGTNYQAWRVGILNPMMNDILQPAFSLIGPSIEESAIVFSVDRHLASLPMEHGHFTLVQSQLNPPPLFGAGLIDKVPDADLEAAAASPDPRFFGIQGRVSRLADGRIGRFGWKAEHASLHGFVLTACAVELGLEVPGRHQGIKPDDPDYHSPGLDLSQEECNALAAFIRNLPAPVQRRPATQREMEAIQSGRASFDQIGCAACHRPKLGPIDGIYSDLLLHDMGESLSNSASYSSVLPDPAEEQGPLADADFPAGPDAFAGEPQRARLPLRREWRTPPLWGLRDSAPYMHDGRAETLEQAIVLHGGQAESVKSRYFRLRPEQRLAMLLFLKSLLAPSTEAQRRASSSSRHTSPWTDLQCRVDPQKQGPARTSGYPNCRLRPPKHRPILRLAV